MDARWVPTELWLQIIREAGSVPYEAYNTRECDPLPLNGTLEIHSMTMFNILRDALSTKFAISLVCRLWNHISTEFLYDFIIVRHALHIPALLKRLSNGDMTLSTRVRRLDFVCAAPRGKVWFDGMPYNVKQLARAAAKLVCLCSRIRMLSSTTAMLGRDTHFLMKMLARTSSTLECLQWYHSHWEPSSVQLLSKLRLPQMQSLHLFSKVRLVVRGPTSSSEDSSESDIESSEEEALTAGSYTLEGPSLPSLHTLGMHFNLGRLTTHLCSGNLSSVRHVVVGQNSRPTSVLDTLIHLPQVNTLTFCRGAFCRVSDVLVPPPTIRVLVFYVQELPISPLYLPHVERIGLKGTETPSPEEYDFIFNLLVGGSGPDDSFPGLKLIRFIDALLARALEKRQMQFKLWGYRCRSKAVRLEDERGRLMEPIRL